MQSGCRLQRVPPQSDGFRLIAANPFVLALAQEQQRLSYGKNAAVCPQLR
jgi:hypothetical protein